MLTLVHDCNTNIQLTIRESWLKHRVLCSGCLSGSKPAMCDIGWKMYGKLVGKLAVR